MSWPKDYRPPPRGAVEHDDHWDGYRPPPRREDDEWAQPKRGVFGHARPGVAEAVEYFRYHLLLREFRPTSKRADEPMVEDCVEDFAKFVNYVVENYEGQGVLDLRTFEQLCRCFSDEWQGTSHWLNHKILSKYLTEKCGIRWD